MEQVRAAGRDWLIECAINRVEALNLWLEDPASPVTMATGRHFDAVVVHDRLGLETLDLISKHGLPATPAMIDIRARKIALLMPSHAQRVFATLLDNMDALIETVHYLAEDGFLVIPGPKPREDSRHQWLVPPNGRPDSSKLRAAAVGLAMCNAAQHLNQQRIPHSSAAKPPATIYPVGKVVRQQPTPVTSDHEWPEVTQ